MVASQLQTAVLSLDGPGDVQVRARCTRAVLRPARSSAFLLSASLLIPCIFRACVHCLGMPSGAKCGVLHSAQHQFAWGAGERLRFCPLVCMFSCA